jgi:IS30 family transposase
VLAHLVRERLIEDWSPQQIAGFLAVTYPDTLELRVSHETIYKTLFIQSRGVLARELTKHLRTHRPIRKHKRHSVKGQLRSQIAGTVSIHDRPDVGLFALKVGGWRFRRRGQASPVRDELVD